VERPFLHRQRDAQLNWFHETLVRLGCDSSRTQTLKVH
jgi:hypothetical protein